MGDALFDQTDDDVVTHQTTSIHDFFGCQPHVSARLDSGTQHVAGGNLGNAVGLANERGLGAFASPGRTQQNQSHCLP